MAPPSVERARKTSVLVAAAEPLRLSDHTT
jgi:hypothetical protein